MNRFLKFNVFILIIAFSTVSMANPSPALLDIANSYQYTTSNGYKTSEVLLNAQEHQEFLQFNALKASALHQLPSEDKKLALAMNLAKYFHDVKTIDNTCQNFSWDIPAYFYYFPALNYTDRVNTIVSIDEFYLSIEKDMNLVRQNLISATERLAAASAAGHYPQGSVLMYLKMYYDDVVFRFGLHQFYQALPQLTCSYCQNIDTQKMDALYAAILTPIEEQFRAAILPLMSQPETLLDIPDAFRTACYEEVVSNLYSKINSAHVLNKGLRELQKSEQQMLIVADSMGFKIQSPESIPAYIKRVYVELRARPGEVLQTKEEYETYYSEYYQRVLGEMSKISSKQILLPLTYEFFFQPESVTSFNTASYSINDPDNGVNPAFYTVIIGPNGNFAKLDLAVLFFHEAIPGHHFERAYSFVNTKSKTDFEKTNYYAEYTEGWGFYVEELALEHNLYKSAEEIFGFWDLQRLRSLRMIVSYRYYMDAWTKQQGTDFFAEHTFGDLEQAEADAARPTDPYGQSISYMIGKTVLQGLRDLQQEELNRCASEVEFHDYILDQTGTAMDTLVSTFSQWIVAHKCYSGSANASEMETRAHQKILNRF